MKHIPALALLVAAWSPPAQETSEPRLRAMLDYLGRLERVEALLAGAKPDDALREAAEALRVAPQDSLWEGARPLTKGGAAQYLAACAHAAKGDVEAALKSLEAAAENGFTGAELVRADVRLKALRPDPRLGAVLGRIAGAPAKDAHAGRIVADQKFGMGLINARKGNFPRLGESAPDFELDLLEGKGTFRLSSLRGKSPAVLIFGSYT